MSRVTINVDVDNDEGMSFDSRTSFSMKGLNKQDVYDGIMARMSSILKASLDLDDREYLLNHGLSVRGEKVDE